MQNVKTRVYVASVTPLADAARFDRLQADLPSWRQAKLAQAPTAADARRSLGAALLLKTAMAAVGVDIRTAAIAEQNGKPYFKDLPRCHFSLSHSGDLVLCAVSSAPVGCDVQQLRSLKNDIAKRFFAADEEAYIAAASAENECRQRFFHLWTRKESVMKATTRGLALPMNSFSVLSNRCTLNNTEYFLKTYKGEAEYCFACCGEVDGFEADMIRIDFSDM